MSDPVLTLRAARIARTQQEQQALAQRREAGWALARVATHLLVTRYGAQRVAVFGSLTDGHWHSRSDIDLAVWGLPVEVYWDAVADLLNLNPEVEFDLVQAERCPESFQSVVEASTVIFPETSAPNSVFRTSPAANHFDSTRLWFSCS